MHDARRQRPGRIAVIAATLVAAAVCNSAFATHLELKKDDPRSLKKHGLLVIQLGPGAWHNARVTLSPGGGGSAHDGFFLAKLKPGQYVLDDVSCVVGEVWRHGVTERDYARQAIGRPFEVQAGKITHLGLLYLVHEPQGPSGDDRSIVLPFSNPGPERRYLEKHFPKLAASLAPSDVIVPEFDYVNDKLALARDYLYRLFADEVTRPELLGIDPQEPVVFEESGWVFGDLGLVVRPGTSPGEFTILENEAINRFRSIGLISDEPLFLDEVTGMLYRPGESGVVRVASVPESFSVSDGLAINGTSVVLVDNRLNLLVSADGGRSWSRNDDFRVGGNKALDVHIQSARHNAYVVGRQDSSPQRTHVVVIDRNTLGFAPLDLPLRTLRHATRLFETDAGVFVQTETGFTPTALYFRRFGDDEWVRNEIRNLRACKVTAPSPTKPEIEALCRSGRERLISSDNGQSWQRVDTAADTE